MKSNPSIFSLIPVTNCRNLQVWGSCLPLGWSSLVSACPLSALLDLSSSWWSLLERSQKFDAVTMLLCYSVTLLLYYFMSLLLFYFITLLLCFYVSLLLFILFSLLFQHFAIFTFSLFSLFCFFYFFSRVILTQLSMVTMRVLSDHLLIYPE